MVADPTSIEEEEQDTSESRFVWLILGVPAFTGAATVSVFVAQYAWFREPIVLSVVVALIGAILSAIGGMAAAMIAPGTITSRIAAAIFCALAGVILYGVAATVIGVAVCLISLGFAPLV